MQIFGIYTIDPFLSWKLLGKLFGQQGEGACHFHFFNNRLLLKISTMIVAICHVIIKCKTIYKLYIYM